MARPKSRKAPEWTIPEMRILEKHYRNLSAAEIQRRHLPHRTVNAIRNMAARVKAGKWKHQAWSDEEEGLLREHYPFEGPSCSGRLPGRTPEAVVAKARELGLSTLWSDEEVMILRQAYPRWGSPGASQSLPHKSKEAVQKKAKELGIRYDRTIGDGTSTLEWTEEEKRLLQQNINRPLSALCELFPERTKIAIKTMRQRLRRGRSERRPKGD